MKTSTLFASIAVASLAVAQPAAAATRSAESLPVSGVQTTQAVERAGSIDAESEALKGKPLLLILLLAGALAALIIAVSGGKSPG